MHMILSSSGLPDDFIFCGPLDEQFRASDLERNPSTTWLLLRTPDTTAISMDHKNGLPVAARRRELQYMEA